MQPGLVGVAPSLQPSRTDRVTWLKDMPQATALRKTMELLRYLGSALSRQAASRLRLTGSTDGMVALYEEGGYYRPHFDCCREALEKGSESERILTTIVYLNEGWRKQDGGALRLLLRKQNAWQQVWPEAGTLLMFRADKMLHEVQASRARRLALTLWHIGREHEASS